MMIAKTARMDTSVLSLIRISYASLSSAQKRVADYVLNHPDRVMISSMYDLAEACHVSEPTIMRFLYKLHYDSYQVFRVNIAQEVGLGRTSNVYYDDIQQNDDIDTTQRKVLAFTAQCLTDCIHLNKPDILEAVVSKLLQAHRILVIGMGASYAPAFDLTHKLLRLGLSATSSNDPHMINIMSSCLKDSDVLFVFSHSGESHEILRSMDFARQNAACCIVITSYPNSSAAVHADFTMLSCSPETNYRSDAMTSRIIQLALIDVLYVCMAQRMGSSAEENINRTRMAVAKNKT